ncbi:ParA family protein [Rhodoluna sp.]|uniref:ParA family protein n=1 Tax=Rhodoluna sp. TaxID=1969481 RepID=UPI0025E6E57C|nr:ParA family protein [Rhodoluna sp.]
MAKEAKAPDNRFAKPKPLATHGPARIIAMCNQKGGVGKTTTSINMSAALAEYGRKVLLIDFDPQGALSAGLGVNAHDALTIYDLMLDRKINPKDAIQKTSVANLDVIPANIELSAAEMKLVNEIAREQILAKILKQVVDDYDLIVIDCQPSLGLLTVNALTAAHGVIIPLATEFFALRGVAILEDIISKVKEGLNPALQLDGILATMVDARTLHSREVLGRLHEAFGQKVFRSVINRTVKFPDATVAQSPITAFAPDSEAAEAYRTVARELVSRGCAP